MVVRELTNKIKGMLSDVDNGDFEAVEMVREVLDLSHIDFMLTKREVTDEEENRVMDMVKKRLSGMPLQYILGYTEFMSLKFFVDEHTLIPRADTETLVEEIIKRSPQRILDIGTGSGAIGISLGYYLPNSKVTCMDISPGAVAMAEKNAELNSVKAEFVLSDIMSMDIEGKYDCIVSNPPYIKSGVIPGLQKEVREYEPLTALDGGEDGLDFYRRIITAAAQTLEDNGILAFETGHDQAEAVSDLMASDFCRIEIVKDLCGIDRVVIGFKKRANV